MRLFVKLELEDRTEIEDADVEVETDVSTGVEDAVIEIRVVRVGGTELLSAELETLVVSIPPGVEDAV